jgi:hypothetical protein
VSAPPVLRRFDIYVFKDKSSTDKSQAPAANQEVLLYRQGATALAETFIPYSGQDPVIVAVPVSSPGAAAIGDRLRVRASEFFEVEVVNIDPDTGTIDVENVADQNITIYEFDRLVNVTDPPLLYRSPIGTDPLSMPYLTDANGRLYGYVKEYQFDYVIPVAIHNPRIFCDTEGSYVMR